MYILCVLLIANQTKYSYENYHTRTFASTSSTNLLVIIGMRLVDHFFLPVQIVFDNSV